MLEVEVKGTAGASLGSEAAMSWDETWLSASPCHIAFYQWKATIVDSTLFWHQL